MSHARLATGGIVFLGFLFICYQTCEHDILKASELISMQSIVVIFHLGPRNVGGKCSVNRDAYCYELGFYSSLVYGNTG